MTPTNDTTASTIMPERRHDHNHYQQEHKSSHCHHFLQSHHVITNPTTNTATNTIRNGLIGSFFILTIIPAFMVGFYSVVASPPLHWMYENPLPHAGPNTVYVPGAGFAGFWFHLGFFHSLFDEEYQQQPDYFGIGHSFSSFINDTQSDLTSSTASLVVNSETKYYCYSSGCLSLLLAVLDAVRNRSSNISQQTLSSVLDSTFDAAHYSQQLWLEGKITKYEIVDTFLNQTIVKLLNEGYVDETFIVQTILPRVHILVTTKYDGVQIRTAASIHDLLHLLKQTTWIPFVTGNGFGKLSRQQKDKLHDNRIHGDFSNAEDWFLDGGFSRTIHPACDHTVSVPTTWQTTIHGLNPGMAQTTVLEMWNMGKKWVERQQQCLKGKNNQCSNTSPTNNVDSTSY